jgi:hypothetical protein
LDDEKRIQRVKVPAIVLPSSSLDSSSFNFELKAEILVVNSWNYRSLILSWGFEIRWPVLLFNLDVVYGLNYYYQVHVDRIVMIQRRFIRFELSRLPWPNSMILPLLDIQPLQSKQINFYCMLIFDLISEKNLLSIFAWKGFV